MLGCWAASTILGVRMHWEQSSVGKVSESWPMWPPMEGAFSTRTTWWPPSAMSSAAWMPAMPPPMTSARLVTGTLIGCERLVVLDLLHHQPHDVDGLDGGRLARSSWTQEQCSRMLAISHRKGFSPASATALRKVFSCMRGEQAATTTPSSLCSLIGFLEQVLPRVGAHVLVVRCAPRRAAAGGLGDLRAVHGAGDVLAAVADEYADS